MIFLNTNTLEHKRPVVQTMLNWSKTHSFSTANKNEEESRITETLRRNGYAPGFSKQCVRKTSKTETLSTSQKQNWWLCIPYMYVEGQFTAMKRILQPYSIATSITPVSFLRDLHVVTHLKDTLPLEQQTKVSFPFPALTIMTITLTKLAEAWKQDELKTIVKIQRSGTKCYCTTCLDQWAPN